MATALLAMKGQFGSTEFYLITMPAKELADRLVIPKEMPEWDDLTLEERFQRDVNYSRVKEHIAPYLAHDPDRFFGAFIVDIFNGEGVEFEPITSMAKGLPKLYEHAAKNLGFLHLQGNEVLVPLDGQHRLAAIKFAISGKDEKSKDIPGLTPNIDVANDSCTVILIKHDTKKARKIFNKVNRYAKATSKADNLITADDDIAAIIAREEIADKILNERMVNYESNTLSAKSCEFTTLSTVYEATLALLNEVFGKIVTTSLPSTADQKLHRSTASEFWGSIVQKITVFQQALQDPTESGDPKRCEIRKDYTLGKPIVQLALVNAILRLQAPDLESGNRLAINTICDRINDLDWSVTNAMWQHVLMNGDKVVTGKQAMNFASRFIAYVLGDKLEKKEREVLENQYISQFPDDHKPKALPKPLFS
jgi:DNA sulfur modification protein DndB